MFDHDFIQTLPVRDDSHTIEGPLKGLVVLDFTHYIAGPLASMLLADLGATVIKIEPPKGDRFRAYPPHDTASPEEGAAYLWANRNKQGIEVDLKHPEGKKAIWALIERADVLIENFATGAMERLGFGYDAVSSVRPLIVYCSVSAYGRTGPLAKRPGFDSIVQAESGFVSMNGYADRPGVRTSSSVMDIGTAMMASNAILAALHERHQRGKGRYVDVSLYGSALLMNGYATMQTLCRGEGSRRHGNTSPDSCPTGVFKCQDSSFFLHCGNSEIFRRLAMDVLQRPDVADRPDYQTAQGRLADQANVFSWLEKEFARFTWNELKPLLDSAKVPAGEVRDLKSALLSPETQSAQLVEKVAHPTLGWIPNIRIPVQFDGALTGGAKPAPLRGEDAIHVLKEFARYDDQALSAAIESGAFYISEAAKASSGSNH